MNPSTQKSGSAFGCRGRRFDRSILSVVVVCTGAAILFGVAGCGAAPKTAGKSMTDRSYAFWPPPPAEPRIQYLRSFALSTDVSPLKQSALDRAIFGDEAQKSVGIQKPYGVTMHDGRIYVCDTRNSTVIILDLAKRQTRLMGVAGSITLQAPVDVTIADDGMIYVADRVRGVVVFDRNERAVQVLSVPELRAIGVAVHGSRLYVANLTTQNVLILDRRNGGVIGSIGTVGDEDGQFRLPLGLDVDAHGNLHVVDVMRCRLQKFTPDGAFIAGVGEMTDVAGNFVRPKHIAVDREGLVYVVDAAFQNVQIFNPQYLLLTSFGGPGWHPGAMNMPAGISVLHADIDLFRDEIHPDFEPDRLIVVTNQFGSDKVAVYALGRLREGRTMRDLSESMAPLDPDILEPGEVNPMSDPAGMMPDDADLEFREMSTPDGRVSRSSQEGS